MYTVDDVKFVLLSMASPGVLSSYPALEKNVNIWLLPARRFHVMWMWKMTLKIHPLTLQETQVSGWMTAFLSCNLEWN